MIVNKKGDLTLATEDIIAHGCNAQGRMRSGVARCIRRTFPEAYHAYMREYNTKGLQLGKVIWAKAKTRDKLIANCITQDKYGYDGSQYVDYTAIKRCFEIILGNAVPYSQTIAIPTIGAGLGGGDWDKIVEIINEVSGDYPVNVYWRD